MVEARAFFLAIYTSCVYKMQTHTQAGWLFSRCLTPTPHAGGCSGVFFMRSVTGSPIEGNVQDITARMAVEQREKYATYCCQVVHHANRNQDSIQNYHKTTHAVGLVL